MEKRTESLMRYLIAIAGGLLVALLLYLLDSQLILLGKRGTDEREAPVMLDFVRVHQEEFTKLKKRVPPKKPERPKEPPKTRRLEVTAQSDMPPPQLDFDMPAIEIAVGGGGMGPYLGNWRAGAPSAEGDALPIVRIEPRYPRKALIEGIEGWVRLEFTILADGTVSDVSVIDSKPRQIFNRSAYQAVLRWKFKPRIIDGKPVSRRARTTVEFELIEDEE